MTETVVVPTGSGPDARLDGATEFAPITRETLSSQIRERLLERITSGALEAGARVPSERTLSEQFGVARTSVREAMQGLLSMGVVVRRGNRSYVAERLPDVSLDQVDDGEQFVEQLFETRRLLEVPMIELAAVRATDVERRAISELADRFTADMTIAALRELDRKFHATLSSACGNPLLVEVHGKVMARLFRSDGFESWLSDEANRQEVDRIAGDTTDQLARIAVAVVDGDVEAAATAAVAHLDAVERRLVGGMV